MGERRPVLQLAGQHQLRLLHARRVGVTVQTCVAGDDRRASRTTATAGGRRRTCTCTDNEFRVDPAAIGCINTWCARQAVLSNFGTFPELVAVPG